MPELADVEGHRRLVAEHAVDREVTGVTVPDPDLLEGTTPQGLGRSLVGRSLQEPRRHGKWLILPFGTDGPRLLVHFRMTGDLSWDGETSDVAGDTDPAVVLDFGDHRLAYRSRRRLGAVHHVSGEDEIEGVTGPLGPDALDVDRERLGELLADRRGGIKSALMDQELVAGLGNELVDEILWRAQVHPQTPVGELDDDALDAVHHQMRDVLTDAVRAGHVPSGPTWLNGQRDAQEPTCPHDGTPLERDQVAGRTTFWCPEEQTA